MKHDTQDIRLMAMALVAVAGCCGGGTETQSPDARPVAAAAEPSDLHADLLARFRERASAEEVRQFDRLAAASDPGSRTRAVEMVLFKMSDKELYALGITQVQQAGRLEWAVAWSTDSPADLAAIDAALHGAGVEGGAFADLGMAGWYVPREKFFRARTALLADDRVRALKTVLVVEPRLAQG
jgi:hypothetical protein